MNNIVKNKEKLQNMKKIKGNLKRFSSLILSLIILLFSFNFSFADSFDSVQIVSDYTNVPSNIDTSISYTPNSSWIYYPCSLSDNVYLLGYYQNGVYYTGFFSESTVSANLIGVRSSDNYSYFIKGSSGVSLDQYSSTYNLYYNSPTSIGSMNTSNLNNINLYESLDSALAAVRSYIDSTRTPSARYPYTFQNGYLFVFDLGNSDTMYSFDLTSKSEEYSNIGSNPFPDTNQSYWFENSLPEIDETTIPSSSAITILWDKGNITNIFGQTQDMKATISGTSTGRYLYIYNPPAHYKWSGSSNPSASETINYPVTINGVSSGDNFYIYDSRALLFDYNQGGKVQGTVTGETGYGSVTSDGAISVTTSEGAIYTQNSGGSTDISGANGGSIAENINGLKETLDNFVSQFIQLLSAPISHIQQLIQSSHEFFDVFSQLFEWLPNELSSVIVSGLIIMVVIGVIKMLL